VSYTASTVFSVPDQRLSESKKMFVSSLLLFRGCLFELFTLCSTSSGTTWPQKALELLDTVERTHSPRRDHMAPVPTGRRGAARQCHGLELSSFLDARRGQGRTHPLSIQCNSPPRAPAMAMASHRVVASGRDQRPAWPGRGRPGARDRLRMEWRPIRGSEVDAAARVVRPPTACWGRGRPARAAIAFVAGELWLDKEVRKLRILEGHSLAPHTHLPLTPPLDTSIHPSIHPSGYGLCAYPSGDVCTDDHAMLRLRDENLRDGAIKDGRQSRPKDFCSKLLWTQGATSVPEEKLFQHCN
jgi:hypothetical protein